MANAGGLLEEISIYLTYQEYDRAMELIFPFVEEGEEDTDL